jgi:hypothetical protein
LFQYVAEKRLNRMLNGSPQGSILRPLLYIIYINDLPSTLNTSSVSIIFADGTSVIISSKNLGDF